MAVVPWTASGLADADNSYRYDPLNDTISTIATPPRVVAETRALPLAGTVWVMGGGRTPPNPNNEVDIYDTGTGMWTTGPSFMDPRRNFPTDTDGTKAWLAGGYAADGFTSLNTMEIYACNVPTEVSAVSRKTHGAAGTFDVDLGVSGPPGIECRSGGATNDYTIVVTFAGPVTVNGTPQAQVIAGSGIVGNGGVSNGGVVTVSGNTVTIPLTNVANAQTLTVRLNSVNNSANVDVSMSVLVGDVNGNAAVNASDVALTKSQVGMAVSSSNFREDLNANGSISSTDVVIVKSDVGTSLPP